MPSATPSATPGIPSPSPTSGWREDFTTGLGSFTPFVHNYPNGQSVDAAHCTVTGGMLRLRTDFAPQRGCMVLGPTFNHGYFEARIRYQKGNGLSPAFWLRRPVTSSTPWDEIDIMEAWPNTNGVQGPNKFTSTVHTWPGGSHFFRQLFVDAGFDLTADWHTFGAYWVPGQRLDVYLDGALKGSITQGVPVQQSFHVTLSHIVGNFSAQPDATTPNPAFMDVDWVRWAETPGTAPPPTAPTLLFGMGPEADGVRREPLYADAPLNLLTSWYNSPNDLSWMTGWEDDLVPQEYAKGHALQLVVYVTDPAVSTTTAYGPACGKPYPISDRFAGDMQALAHTFRPRAPGDRLYVTMFTELQTYSCVHNRWVGNENYYRALQDSYREALDIFHAVGGKVALSWGGWQNRWDDPANGAGRSMLPYFADVMNASDFQAFQAMQGDSNITDIQNMTSLLAPYGGGVLLAHYLPDGAICGTYDADVHALLTDAGIADLKARGLFGWSFMSADCLEDATRYAFVRDAVRRYGAN